MVSASQNRAPMEDSDDEDGTLRRQLLAERRARKDARDHKETQALIGDAGRGKHCVLWAFWRSNLLMRTRPQVNGQPKRRR